MGIEPLRYRRLLAECDRKFKAYEAAGCKTYFNKKDHLWTLYAYETGAFKIPEAAEPGTIYGGCNCGNCHMTILPTGDLYACRRVQNSKVGNVFQDRIADVWVCQMERYRDYDRFEKCVKCVLKAWCRGCPAVASGRDGDFTPPTHSAGRRLTDMNETIQTILRRRSIRRFDTKQLPEDTLDQILQAGLYAPSAGRPAGRAVCRLSGPRGQRTPRQNKAGKFQPAHGDSGELCLQRAAEYCGRPQSAQCLL